MRRSTSIWLRSPLVLAVAVQFLVSGHARGEDAAVALRLASWNIAGIAPQEKAVEAPARWRHTFGAERTSLAPVARDPVKAEADVIALQGVASVRQARSLFPARAYHVVVSRQMLLEDRGAPPAANAEPTLKTAIVVRRRADLRIVAQEHLLRLGAAPDGMTSGPAGVAGTAVKIALPGQGSLWLLSVDLSPACDAAECGLAERQLAGVATWLEAKRTAGEPAIVAGSFRRALGPRAARSLGEAQQFPPPRVLGQCRSNRPESAFDLILLTPDRGLERDHSRRGAILPVSASGHCPIRLDLDLRPRNADDHGAE